MENIVVPDYLIVYVPVIVWLLNWLKIAIPNEKFKRFLPGVSLLGGVALALIAKDTETSYRAATLAGLLAGVAASGFHESLKMVPTANGNGKK